MGASDPCAVRFLPACSFLDVVKFSLPSNEAERAS